MINLTTDLNKYICDELGITEIEFNDMFDHSVDNISGPADIKVAISHTIKANRLLAKLYARTKGMLEDKNKIYEDKVSEIREKLYLYKKEISSGKSPLADKEILEAEYQKRIDIIARQTEETEKKDSPLPTDISMSENPPTYTTDDISIYTSNDINAKTTETTIKEIAAAAARKEASAELSELTKLQIIISKLQDGVHKELSALGNLSYTIGSEQYGMNKQHSLEKDEKINRW
jgi:hypothetical protein